MKSDKLKLDFGKQIKASRLKKGISQEQLAWGSGLDHTTIWRIENGITDPRLSTVYLLAEVLDTKVSELLIPQNEK